MFGASRSMIGTALSLLRVQATEVVWLGRGQSSNNRDCAAVLVFSSLEEASRALDGLNAVHAPFASSLSGGRLVARWANQRAGSQGSESRAMGSASDAAGQIRPSVAPRMQTRQGEDAHGKGDAVDAAPERFHTVAADAYRRVRRRRTNMDKELPMLSTISVAAVYASHAVPRGLRCCANGSLPI